MCNAIEHVNRVAWDESFPDVVTLCTIEDRDHIEAYKRAKYAKNTNQAKELMVQLKGTKNFKKAIGVLKGIAKEAGEDIILVPISSLEKGYDARNKKSGIGSNPLPMAIALAVSDETGWEINTDVVQTNIVGHTGADTIGRFAYPAMFSGNVEKGKRYIVIDDHVSQGGTVANCMGHIESQGGKVAAVCSLTANRTSRCLRMSSRTQNKLMHAENFATIGCHADVCEKVLGYPLENLTNSEGMQILYGLQEGKKKKGDDYNLQSFFNDIIKYRNTTDITKSLHLDKENHVLEKMNGNFMPKHGKFVGKNNEVRMHL